MCLLPETVLENMHNLYEDFLDRKYFLIKFFPY